MCGLHTNLRKSSLLEPVRRRHLATALCVHFLLLMFSVCNHSVKVNGHRGHGHLGSDGLIDHVYFIAVLEVTYVNGGKAGHERYSAIMNW